MREYTCLDCGHSFSWSSVLGDPRCPRCGSTRLRANPWLFGTDHTPSEEDYRTGYFEP